MKQAVKQTSIAFRVPSAFGDPTGKKTAGESACPHQHHAQSLDADHCSP